MCICKNCFSVISCGENICLDCGQEIKEEEKNCCELSDLYYRTLKEKEVKREEEKEEIQKAV